MDYKFTKRDYKKIAKALDVKEPMHDGNLYRFEVENFSTKQRLTLEIFPDLAIGSRTGNMVQLYTAVGMMQMHFCTNFVASDELGEVIFFAEAKDKISGFAIGKDAGCSFYANVDKDILSKDPFKLSGEILGCAMQLSLTEVKLDEIK